MRKTGAKRASRVFKTETEALSYARQLAQKEQVALYIHRKDGTISKRYNYKETSLAA